MMSSPRPPPKKLFKDPLQFYDNVLYTIMSRHRYLVPGTSYQVVYLVHSLMVGVYLVDLSLLCPPQLALHS